MIFNKSRETKRHKREEGYNFSQFSNDLWVTYNADRLNSRLTRSRVALRKGWVNYRYLRFFDKLHGWESTNGG